MSVVGQKKNGEKCIKTYITAIQELLFVHLRGVKGGRGCERKGEV